MRKGQSSLSAAVPRSPLRAVVLALVALAAVVVVNVLSGAEDGRVRALLPLTSTGEEYASRITHLAASHSAALPHWWRASPAGGPPRGGTVVPLRLAHLSEARAPFDSLHIVSAWLDTRPFITENPPEVVLLATSKGVPYYDQQRQAMVDHALKCVVKVAHTDGSRASFTADAIAQPQDTWDSHSYEVELIYLQYICPLRDEDGQLVAEWEKAEITATLTLAALDPPDEAFVPVTRLPTLDVTQHQNGEGASALCLPPLSGDFYAPFLADYFAHYRALGFSLFFPYLLDPGPETLRVLRELMEEHEGIAPVRWAIPRGWLKEGAGEAGVAREYAVPPAEWDLAGLGSLPRGGEAGLAGPVEEKHLKLWYFGQGPAIQDCAYRAMAAGSRWMIAADYDEWLSLRPPDGAPWPPMQAARGTTDSHTPLEENDLMALFAANVPAELAQWWAVQPFPDALDTQRDALMAAGRLASAYEFRNVFVCLTCRPSLPPHADSAGRDALEAVLGWDSFEWQRPGVQIPLVYSSPVRHIEPFRDGRRSKTLVDPWAWRLLGIHLATMSYLEWTMVAGPCATRVVQSPSRKDPFEFDPLCASQYLDAFGPPTYLVDAPTGSSNAEQPAERFAHSQGALFHARVARRLRTSLVELEQKHGSHSLPTSAAALAEAKELVDRARRGPDESEWKRQFTSWEFGPGAPEGDPRLELVQDWGMVDVMGHALAERLRSRSARPSAAAARLSGSALELGGALVAGAVALAGYRRYTRAGAIRRK